MLEEFVMVSTYSSSILMPRKLLSLVRLDEG